MRKKALLFVILLLSIPLALLLYSKFTETKPEGKILSAVVEEPTPKKLSPTPTKKPTPTPSKKLSKESYIIAIYGDSMVDTMGERLEYVEHELTRVYPGTTFNLYNYGIGGENVEMGLARWGLPFSNRDRNYPPITEINPDVIIMGSFSYNTFDPHDRERHRQGLRKIIAQAQGITPDVYLMAEIAPLGYGFGRGKNGPNMPYEAALDQSHRILEQLDDSLALSGELNIPVIDVYSISQLNGRYGEKSNVNPDDGIHPSVEGHLLTARVIVETLNLK